MGKQKRQPKRWCPECQTLSRAYEPRTGACTACGAATLPPPTGDGGDYERLTGRDPRRVLPPRGAGRKPL